MCRSLQTRIIPGIRSRRPVYANRAINQNCLRNNQTRIVLSNFKEKRRHSTPMQCNSCKTPQNQANCLTLAFFATRHGLLFRWKNAGDARISNKRQSNWDSCQVFLRPGQSYLISDNLHIWMQFHESLRCFLCGPVCHSDVQTKRKGKFICVAPSQ